MGMDLVGHGSNRFYFTLTTWDWHLKVAFEHGWHPRGTRAGKWEGPNGEHAQYYYEGEDWDGSYSHNAGQWVEAEDAASLADALERALLLENSAIGEVTAITRKFDDPPSLAETISREFIEFCRLGAFSIW